MGSAMSGGLFFTNDDAYRRGLREPFPPEQIGKLPKAGTMLDFVGHAAVTDRLNQVAPDWTFEIEPVVITGKDGMPHVLAVPGRMTIGGKTLPECGEVDRASNYGDELKRGISDFIRRGAMRFGVALDLWSREDLSNVGGADELKAQARPAAAQSIASAESSPDASSGGSRVENARVEGEATRAAPKATTGKPEAAGEAQGSVPVAPGPPAADGPSVGAGDKENPAGGDGAPSPRPLSAPTSLEDPYFQVGQYANRPYSEVARKDPEWLRKAIAGGAFTTSRRELAEAWLEKVGAK